MLDKECGKSVLPNGESDTEIANTLGDFFEAKVRKIYEGIEAEQLSGSSSTPEDSDGSGSSHHDSSFTEFSPILDDELKELINSMPDKTCSNDPIPTWLYKKCVSQLINITSIIVNLSLSGNFPSVLKEASIRPGLKKANLDSDELKNYRPISNLTFMSKLIEKCVHKQITGYIEENDLFADLQSGYRKAHSCETAITRIHNDLLCIIDNETNALLLLLDLSAAFDTVNHRLLIRKLHNFYGIGGNVIKWLESYLSDRSFQVKIKQSNSKSYVLEIGVPQGSILGPLLFILYTKDLQDIVTKYGLSVHLYADDTQIYLALDVHSTTVDLTKITACFSEIRSWMSDNFLKLNEDKTEIMDIGLYESNIAEVQLHSETIIPVLKAKNLGFYFDHLMTLDEQILYTQKVCNINLRNLKRIASKLPYSLKIQLVYSCVFSIMVNCNSTYGALPNSTLQKLQKIQNDAVRFIFNIRGKKRWEPITPYLKRLHFLPVKFRIKFKIALLVFKCLNNLAPKYLSSLVKLRIPGRYSVRLDSDYYLLETAASKNIKRAEGAFSFIAPRIWNELPFSLRSLNELFLFKKHLKTYYFNVAFSSTSEDL